MSVPGAELRATAARSLVSVLAHGRSLKAELAERLPAIADPRDRALLEAICFVTLRHYRRYRFVLDAWMQRPLRDREVELQCLLLSGLGQLDGLKLSPHAAVAATAEAARLIGRAGQVGLVNALLRRAARETLPESPDLAVRYSHPRWLLAALEQDWPGEVENIFAGNNTPAPMWLVVNPRQHTRGEYLGRLLEAGIEAQLAEETALGLRLAQPRSPESLPDWSQGAAWVQDGAAQLAVEALAPAPGAAVLDACAAPGGKSAQLAARLDASGLLLAIDIDKRRIRHLKDGLQRLRLAAPNVEVLAADATDPSSYAPDRRFDAILLDAPCSATGIIRRQPDIKWHRRADDIPALVELQARLLDASFPLLKPGGRLLYATCSVLKDENARQVDAFLARTPDAQALPLEPRFGRASGAGRQRFPGEQGMDGFFYALLGRRDG